MTRLLWRVLRDLALVPVTAVLVYLVVMNLPYRADSDRKIATAENDVRAQLEKVLGKGTLADAVVPWQRVWRDEPLGVRAEPYTGRDVLRALGRSLGLGAVALALAGLWAMALAFVRVSLRERRGGAVVDAVPSLVFGTPLFLLAAVAALVAVANGVPFQGSVALAAVVMAVGPGTFLGVVLSDALVVERAKPYVRTALAKGCSPTRALVVHALPNAVPALLDALSPVAAALLLGSFVAESFFGLPGFGRLYLRAAQDVDPGVVVVATSLFASLLILTSLAVELVRWWVDPKARSAR